MRTADDESASEALAEFARRIIRDDIGSDELVRYMDEQLRVQLIEPHALCRQTAAAIARGYPGLSPCEVARCLMRVARSLREATPADFDATPNDAHPDDLSCADTVTVAPPDAKASPVPEFVASLAFTAAGIVQFGVWLHLVRHDAVIGWDSWQLSVALAAFCIVAGILFLTAGLRQMQLNRNLIGPAEQEPSDEKSKLGHSRMSQIQIEHLRRRWMRNT